MISEKVDPESRPLQAMDHNMHNLTYDANGGSIPQFRRTLTDRDIQMIVSALANAPVRATQPICKCVTCTDEREEIIKEEENI